MEKKFYNAENRTRHYNFLIIDREIIFITENGKNEPSPLGLSLEAIGLYAVLKAHAIDKNYTWPSLKELERLTRKRKNTLLKYLAELQTKKLIEIQTIKNPKGGIDKNVYVMNEIDKDGLKKQRSKTEPCKKQGVNFEPCKVQNLNLAAEIKGQILNPKYNNYYNNINIISGALKKISNQAAKPEFNLLHEKLLQIFEDEQSIIELQGDTLIVQHEYIDTDMRQTINQYLDSLNVYGSIKTDYREPGR